MRTHVKNQQRRDLLKRTLRSMLDKKINLMGNLYILDDNSPQALDVEKVAFDYGARYVPAKNHPGDTKNGLGESLAIGDMGESILCVCDDIVFGKDSSSIITKYLDVDIPAIEDANIRWGMISLFASYGRGPLILGTDFWEYPIPAFYAGLAVIYSSAFRKEYVKTWDSMVRGEIPKCPHQDDLFCKEILNASGTRLFGVKRDLVQHTGIDARTFGDSIADPGTHYLSSFFVGE